MGAYARCGCIESNIFWLQVQLNLAHDSSRTMCCDVKDSWKKFSENVIALVHFLTLGCFRPPPELSDSMSDDEKAQFHALFQQTKEMQRTHVLTMTIILATSILAMLMAKGVV